MPDKDTSKLIVQLRTLLQLTQTEAQIAQARQAQARTNAVREELAQNESNARKRSEKITKALADLGGVPDVVSPLLGRLAALVKTVVEQAEPLEAALLEDLALEHQLFDRARYVKVLATSADNAKVRRLAEELETAHEATVEWLSTVLAEEALGGPTALRATPMQAVAGTASRIINTPARVAAGRVNRAVATVKRSRGKAEKLEREGVAETKKAAHQARVNTGRLRAEELPIKGYDELSTNDAVTAIKKLSEPEDLRAIINYEERNKDRKGVVSVTQTQLARVAKEVAGIS